MKGGRLTSSSMLSALISAVLGRTELGGGPAGALILPLPALVLAGLLMPRADEGGGGPAETHTDATPASLALKAGMLGSWPHGILHLTVQRDDHSCQRL